MGRLEFSFNIIVFLNMKKIILFINKEKRKMVDLKQSPSEIRLEINKMYLQVANKGDCKVSPLNMEIIYK